MLIPMTPGGYDGPLLFLQVHVDQLLYLLKGEEKRLDVSSSLLEGIR